MESRKWFLLTTIKVKKNGKWSQKAETSLLSTEILLKSKFFGKPFVK